MKYTISQNCIFLDREPDFKAILDCGQIFRYKLEDDGYEVFSADKKCVAKGSVILTSEPDYFVNFFDLDTDYDVITSKLCKFDELKADVEFGKGIRLLRQDFFETIISFIISANNNIPRIKGIIERLCTLAGDKKDGYYAFPTPQRLSLVSEKSLRDIGAGFRDKYIFRTTQIITSTDILKRIASSDTEQARKLLLTLPGVGPKVADCILLFGLRRFDCFPVDTWMMKRCKTDELDTPQKVRDYYLNRYGEYAGPAQQYIFYGAREK